MSINKYSTKSGSRYAVRLYVSKDENGKQNYYVKKGFKTEKEAKLHEARKKIEIEDVGFNKPTDSSFKSIYEDWLPTYQNRVQETTFQRTTDIFRIHILPKLGDKKVSAITPVYCQNTINEWASYYTNIKQLKSYSSQIFEHAIFSELLQRNPMQNVKLPKKQKTESNNYFNLDELKHFMKLLHQEEPLKHVLIFQLLITTGVRKGELTAIRWSDIDFEEKLLTVGNSYATIKNEDNDATRKTKRIKKDTKNDSSNRILPLDNQTLSLLQQWRSIQAKELFQFGVNTNNPNQLVFTYVNGDGDVNQPLHADYANNIMKRLEKKTSIKTCHYPRITAHTCHTPIRKWRKYKRNTRSTRS